MKRRIDRIKELQHDSQLSDIPYTLSNDFLNILACAPFHAANIQTGTCVDDAGTAKHPGVIKILSHASNANSGYLIKTHYDSVALIGGEKCIAVFKTASNTNVTRFIGLHDSWSHSDPVDGCYIKLSGTTLTGNTSAGSTRTASEGYTVAANTWYRIKIEVNSDMSAVTFALYEDDTATVLWTATITANIPKTGQVFGFCDSCTLSTSTGAIAIGYLDYVKIILPNARRID